MAFIIDGNGNVQFLNLKLDPISFYAVRPVIWSLVFLLSGLASQSKILQFWGIGNFTDFAPLRFPTDLFSLEFLSSVFFFFFCLRLPS